MKLKSTIYNIADIPKRYEILPTPKKEYSKR